MSESLKWRQVDASEIANRRYLKDDDKCYYYMVRVKGGHSESYANRIISNLKISKQDLVKNPVRGKYKLDAVNKMILALEEVLKNNKSKKFIFIPAARSIPRNDENFDKAFDYVVEQICMKNPLFWFCEKILDVDITHDSVHSNEDARTIENVKNHLVLDDFKTDKYKDADYIVIIDDVLTHGTHFRVWKDSIMKNYPDIKDIFGLFFALHKFQEPTIEEIEL